MVGLFDTNVISDVFGSGTLTDIVYVRSASAASSTSRGCSTASTSVTTRRTCAAPEQQHRVTKPPSARFGSRNNLELGHQAVVLVVEHVAVDDELAGVIGEVAGDEDASWG